MLSVRRGATVAQQMDSLGYTRADGRLDDQDVRAQRLGHALRRLAAELVDAKEHVRRLQRENDSLRSQLGVAAAGDEPDR
jgi:hypothetical protein